ncbi:MAG: nitroreductase family protein [Lacrimispora sp.]|uniref:nitroreductase family protein n=1 Tax=Lacrimispora sp. TaxID=2719234 RepID=UPI0039E7006C
MNSISQLLKERVSLRRYEKKAIREEDMEVILNAALSSPSACNQMHYSILKIEDEKRKEQIAQLCNHQKFIATAPVILVFLADQYKWTRYNQLKGVEQYAMAEGIGFRQPDLSDLLLAFEDTMIAAHSAVIAAESLGIGSCYIGSTLVSDRELSELLNLPPHVVPLMVLPMGYYPENFKRVHMPRFEKRFVVFEETYHALDDEELEEMFQSRAERYYHPSEKERAQNYAQAFYKQKTGHPFMTQMTESLEQILSRWHKRWQ